MNLELRKLLIDQCRLNRPVYYEDIAKKLNLNLELIEDRNTLSNHLTAVSTYENEKGRPLISAAVIYKNANDHGSGFYTLCENLGFGKAKDLHLAFYGFTELEKSKKFWNEEFNFNQFYEINVPIYSEQKHPFFNLSEFNFFKSWAEKTYDKDNLDHYNAKEFLLDTVCSKTKFWSLEIVKRLEGYECSTRRIWSQMGWDNGKRVSKFKHYTWARIYKNGHDGNEIFFTVGIDTFSDAAIYKLDYFHEDSSDLTKEQKDLCEQHIPKNMRWNEIDIEEIAANWNWEKLISHVVEFISKNSHHYDKLVELVWGNEEPEKTFTNHLTKRSFPSNGFSSLPILNPSFNPTDLDFIEKNIEDKSLGDAGEDIVKNHEINILKNKGLFDLASKVSIRKDGEGYDVLSFNENGQEKFIEVKTTRGDEKTPFFLSINEKLFYENNRGKYCIYRLYNYNDERNTADFFEVSSLEENLLFQPMSFKVYVKKND